MREGESIRPTDRCGGYPVNLRWRDLDHQGHVYHATILTLLDEARTAWLHSTVKVAQPDSYVVARVELDYRSPLLQRDGGVVAHFRPLRVGTTSITVSEKVCSARTRVVVAESITTIVMWDRQSAAPRPISASERENLVDERNLALSEGGQP
jgi:acyl-CoA thioester hydrolase